MRPRGPRAWNAFGWHIWRQGLETVKNTVAGGQYEYPRGLFYGGSGPTASTRVVVEHCDAWIGEAQDLLHIDLHTGLGGYALPTLLVHDTAESPRYAWYAQTFGADNVEPLARSKGTAYRANGVFGQWMKQHFAARNYRFAGAEFGTYPILRVLSAIRAENRAHHYCTPEDPAILRSKLELLECFCPQASQWRHDALSAALRILERGINALREPKSAPVAQPA
ncbi:MAG: DUF2817 domain-containing protein [Betaproteobacteria bacterium]|nr:DUF2817 domain-containing protein [Betaproteobacteria bacterium]